MKKEAEMLLDRVLNKPGLYVGTPSIERIKAFIDGYALCMRDYGIKMEEGVQGDFQEFVQERYGIDSHNWAEIIRFYSTSERNAFDNLVKIFNEFRGLE